jgi:hypothetical protein
MQTSKEVWFIALTEAKTYKARMYAGKRVCVCLGFVFEREKDRERARRQTNATLVVLRFAFLL